MTRLQQLREERGWTKAELARRARINAQTVGWAEDKRFRLYDSQLRKLAKALKAPVDQAASLLEDING